MATLLATSLNFLFFFIWNFCVSFFSVFAAPETILNKHSPK